MNKTLATVFTSLTFNEAEILQIERGNSKRLYFYSEIETLHLDGLQNIKMQTIQPYGCIQIQFKNRLKTLQVFKLQLPNFAFDFLTFGIFHQFLPS